MKKCIFLLLFCIQFSFGNVPYWSKTGHRVIGKIAQEELNGKTKRALDKLLDGQSIASISNFADEIKADRRYREFSAWHYVNIPPGKKYTDIEPSKYGDLVVGIQKCRAMVENEHNSKEDRVFYLKLLIHLIGDLHQPMHVGRYEDKGGNDIQVQWFGNGSNLHRVWDANMINDYGMSYSELASSLPELDKKEKKAIQNGTILDWVHESQEIADKLYDSVEVGEKLAYRYSYTWWGTVEIQLQKGGLRLAKVLNDLF
ncbi:S1/P1 nuclease [Maribacter sp. HTCC2170]|uniref:S1/P1 nuclease n=1 Tax=Maribacter sp. (strain HTCC2170 / KCCM 42371) TaxID=313603 RepID=UPI00006ADA3E|nr:S1/P1 nuclease [Maribacter sp. HTCC2170]EAQ99854.1 putative S1/P1 Nuclease [Maribacter sp. HTCC2170]